MGHVALAAPLPLPLYHIATSYVSSQKPLDVSPLSAPPLSPTPDLANPRLIFFCMCHVELFSTRKIFEIYLSNILLQFLQGVWQKKGVRGDARNCVFFNMLAPASLRFSLLHILLFILLIFFIFVGVLFFLLFLHFVLILFFAFYCALRFLCDFFLVDSKRWHFLWPKCRPAGWRVDKRLEGRGRGRVGVG